MLNAKLIVVGGDAKAAEIRLSLPTIIGRGHDATLTLPHPLVSRQHCEIFEQDGALLVRDLRSLNGTYVDNHRIEGTEPLQPDQLLTIGNVTFRAVYALGVTRDEPVTTEEASSVIEIDEAAPADADSKVGASQSDSIHSRPTQPGKRPATDAAQEKGPQPLPLEETVDVNELRQEHSVCAAMAEIGAVKEKGNVSLSGIERQLPKSAGDVEPDDISIHDESNPTNTPQSFHGIDHDEESDDKVPPDDSRLGSFIRKLPR